MACIKEYYAASRKDEALQVAAMWMELEGRRLSEVSQREKTNTK